MKLTKCISLKYPTAWATLGLLLMSASVAFADIYMRSDPVEGAFSAPSGGGGVCSYNRQPDICSNTNGASRQNCITVANGHHQNWSSAQAPNGTCPVVPTTPVAGAMVNHATVAPAPTPPPP
jgi:hypothetical protein